MAGPPTLPPAATRVFWNVADAWYPPAAEGDPQLGAAQMDLLDPLGAALRSGEDIGLARALRALEWLPRLRGRRAGFSWLPRAERRAILDALERSGFRCLRVRAQRLHELVDACYERARVQRSSPSA